MNLNPRQLLLLQLIADGYTHQQIAKRTGSTHVAVKSSAKLLLKRLGALNAAHAVALGYQLGVLDTREAELLIVLERAEAAGGKVVSIQAIREVLDGAS